MHSDSSLSQASEQSSRTAGWLTLGIACFGLYAFASLVPRGDTWGLHALAYVSPLVRYAGLAVCLLLLLPPVQRRVLASHPTSTSPLLPIGLAGVAFVAFFAFPIRTEVYGDTRTILRHWTDNAAMPSFSLLLDFNVFKTDAALTQILLRTIAHTFSMSIESAFRWVSAISGALCLGLWIQFVRTAFPRSRWTMLLVIAGIGAGANQIFFGHVETYAFAFLTSMALLIAAYLALEGRVSLWVVAVAFLLALKAHSIAICFVPALLFVAASRLSRGRGPGWAWTASFLVIPTLVAGLGLYFFYFRSFAAAYSGARTGTAQTFLPMLSGNGERDYSLFSPAHLLDLGNVMLLVGMPTLLILIGVVTLHRREIDWRRPAVIFAALALLFPLLFLLAVNPLLSMPRDWDLFALIGAPLLVFLAALMAAMVDRPGPAPHTAEGTALAFSVFSVAFYVLNASPALLGPRLEQVGEHIFRTYYTNASYLIVTAQGMDPDTTRSIARRLDTIRRLKPSVVGEDEEYTHLLSTLASVYRARGLRKEAVYWAERATVIAPGDSSLALTSADYLLWADDLDRADQRIARILEAHPSNYDALVLGAIASARRENYSSALAYLQRARLVAPRDPDLPIWEANMRARLARQAAPVTHRGRPVS
jgi:hypothetical protein